MSDKKIKDPEVKQAWVEALRSGKYEQGTGALRTTSGRYCCLGVLCDIMAQRDPEHVRWEENSLITEFGDEDGVTQMRADDGLLPDYLADLLGIDDNPDVYVESLDDNFDLIHLNDDEGFTFEQIADLVEAEL